MSLKFPAIVLAAGLAVLIPSTPRSPTEQDSQGGVVTLYAHDETRSSFSFSTGTFGSSIFDGALRLEGADLTWNLLDENLVTVGFDRNVGITLIALGNPTVNPIVDPKATTPQRPASVYHTLRLDGNQVTYDGPRGVVGRIPAANGIALAVPTVGVQTFEPQTGHVYVMRVRGVTRPRREGVYKFRVLDVNPGHTLTFEWASLIP